MLNFAYRPKNWQPGSSGRSVPASLQNSPTCARWCRTTINDFMRWMYTEGYDNHVDPKYRVRAGARMS